MIISHRYAVAAAFPKYFLSQCFEFPSLIPTSPQAWNFQDPSCIIFNWLLVRFFLVAISKSPSSPFCEFRKVFIEMSQSLLGCFALMGPSYTLFGRVFLRAELAVLWDSWFLKSSGEGKPAGLALVSQLKNSLGYILPLASHAFVFWSWIWSPRLDETL